MPMVEFNKADAAGTFWLNTDRIISVEENDSHGRRTYIGTDDGSKHATYESASAVAAKINTKPSAE